MSAACSNNDQNECLEQTKVKEIVALMYRDAKIKLDDGSTMIVNQATLKPGDTICKKWKY